MWLESLAAVGVLAFAVGFGDLAASGKFMMTGMLVLYSCHGLLLIDGDDLDSWSGPDRTTLKIH